MKFSSVLITGASSGIGRALALKLAKPNVNLALFGRNSSHLNALKLACEERGAYAQIFTVDVGNQEMMKKHILSYDDKHPLDLVIANAGIGTGQSAQKNQGRANPYEIINTNVLGLHYTIEPLIDRFKARKKGHIALMSSLASYRGFSKYYVYNATKAYVRIYGEGLHLDLKKNGVAVSTIAPGFVKTPLTDTNPFKMPLIMSADKAAKIINKGLLAKKPLIAFPLTFYFLSRLISSLPTSIANFIAARFG